MSEKILYPLTDELQFIETRLKSYEPQRLNADLLDRVEYAIHSLEEKVAFEMSDEDFDLLESHLAAASPLEFSDEVLERMCGAMDHWEDHEKLENEILVEPSDKLELHKAKPRLWGRGMLASAAAMVMLGAVTALVLPSVKTQEKSLVVSPSNKALLNPPPPPAVENTWVASNDFLSHKVTRTLDTGIVYGANKLPMRKIRVDYIEQLRANDEKGREVEINTPKCEYVLIPVETY